MAIARPAAPTAPTPPAVPGLDGASEAVGGLPDFGAAGQSAIEGAQQRAASAAQAGQDAAQNARAAGERLMGTPERKTKSEGTAAEGGDKGKLEQKPANTASEAGGAKSQVTGHEAATLPLAAQAAQEKAGTETRAVNAPIDEPPQGFGMMHLMLVAIVCAVIGGILAYKFLHKGKGTSSPAMRAAREAELLAELETIRAAREKRESDRAAKVAAAGLSAIAGDRAQFSAAKGQAAENSSKTISAAALAGAHTADSQTLANAGAASFTANTLHSKGASPAAAASGTAPDASMFASLSEALSAFREASRMMDGEAKVTAAEEARKAARIAALRQDREEKKEGERGGFEIRI